MKPNSLFLLTLSIIIVTTIWYKLFPTQQFIEPQCLTGLIKQQQKWIRVVDCVACYNFPIQVWQKGWVQLRNGLPYMPVQEEATPDQYQLRLVAYMQKECIEYQCKDLHSGDKFYNSQVIQQANLQQFTKLKTHTKMFWDISFKYNNYISSKMGEHSMLTTLFNNLFSPFLPYPTLIEKQFYNGMAIKLRYTQPQTHSSYPVEKPIVKISFLQETKAVQLAICGVVFFVIVLKMKLVEEHGGSGGTFGSWADLFVGFAFVNPQLFSLVCLVLFCKKNVMHVFTLLIFITSLLFDSPQIVTIGIILSSYLQQTSQNNQVTPFSLICLNVLIVMSLFTGIEIVVIMSPLLLWVFCFEAEDRGYSRIGTSQGSKGKGKSAFGGFRRGEENQNLRVGI